MSAKLKYLKRYEFKKSIKKKKASLSNFNVVDDDVNWRSTVVDDSNELECDDDSDEAPFVAEVQDETKIKWQPLASPTVLERNSISKDLSPPRRRISDSIQQDGKKSKSSKRSCIQECAIPIESIKRNNSSIEDEVKKDKKQEFIEWGRGVAQIDAAAKKEQYEQHEMSKPLARYADDEDLERMLKDRQRDGDPMLMFMKTSKRHTINKSTKGKPQFEGNCIPNRYGIRPGYRWDGVDRSNGFEKTWFSKSADRKAIEQESYKWSVEDM